jgi:hypothetical protein
MFRIAVRVVVREDDKRLELKPRYCDIVVARWEALTGSEAQRLTAEST